MDVSAVLTMPLSDYSYALESTARGVQVLRDFVEQSPSFTVSSLLSLFLFHGICLLVPPSSARLSSNISSTLSSILRRLIWPLQRFSVFWKVREK